MLYALRYLYVHQRNGDPEEDDGEPYGQDEEDFLGAASLDIGSTRSTERCREPRSTVLQENEEREETSGDDLEEHEDL